MLGAAESPIGKPALRIDGAAKVTGQARYADDEPVANPAFAWLVTSSIARGRIRGMDLTAARAVPGVLDILTHENVGGAVEAADGTRPEARRPRRWRATGSGTTARSSRVVVADSFEAAREAGYKVVVDYDAETPSATFDSPGVETERKVAKAQKRPGQGRRRGRLRRRAGARSTRATPRRRSITTRSSFSPPPASGTGRKLTIYEPTQGMYGLRAAVAKQLGMDLGLGPHRFALCRRRLRLEGRAGRAHRLDRARRQAAGAAGEARPDTRAGLHHRHLSRRNPTSPAARRDARRQAHRAHSRGLGGHLAAVEIQRLRRRYDRAHVRLPKHRDLGQRRPRRPQHAGLHARAARHALHVRARKRHGRARLRARHGPGRAAADQRHANRSGRRQAVLQPLADEMFRPGRGERFGWPAATRSRGRCATAIG